MANYEDHINNLKAQAVASANKALDFLDGDQKTHLEDLLNCKVKGIKKWKERGVQPIVVNTTGKIISRSALSYSEAPLREIVDNDAATDELVDILKRGEFNSVMEDADKVARLLKQCIVLAQAAEVVGEEKKILFSVLHRGNCDVDYDFKNGTIRSLLYQSAGMSANGNKLYHYWDAEEVVDIEEDGDNNYKIIGRESHGYGMIPAAVLWDDYKPRAGFWHKTVWDELVMLNEAVNMFHTEVKFNQRYQAFPALFTNAQLPDGAVIGPDTAVQIEGQVGENIYLEYKAATSVSQSLTAFNEWLDGLSGDIADNWGVNLRVAGSGSADSGFKLVVEELWNLETRRERIKSAKAFEFQMFKVIKAISDDQGMGVPSDAELHVDFGEPKLPVDEMEEWTITKEKIATKYMPVEEAWKKENPDITDEQIAERKRMINSSIVVPTFGDLVTDAADDS